MFSWTSGLLHQKPWKVRILSIVPYVCVNFWTFCITKLCEFSLTLGRKFIFIMLTRDKLERGWRMVHLTLYNITRNQALWAWILEFEMSVYQICEFNPFWMKKKNLQKDTHSNSSLYDNSVRKYVHTCSVVVLGWGLFLIG